VWSELPKPSLISDALEQEAISIFETGSYSTEGPEVKSPIISVVEQDKILLDPDSEEDLDTSTLSRTLYLKQEVELFA
jgi:hypothetical protein